MIHEQRLGWNGIKRYGFTSLKYPITDVKISRYFLPGSRDLIADECNIVGYMNIPPVEIENEPPENYFIVREGEDWVAICTVRSGWQQALANEIAQKRYEAEKRKKGSKYDKPY